MPSKRKKMRQEKRKKRGGEKAKSKSQDCCVNFKPISKFCFLHKIARTSQADILHLTPVVQISIQWIVQLVSLILIHWIVIYPMDNAIQLLDNWGLDQKALKCTTCKRLCGKFQLFMTWQWPENHSTSLKTRFSAKSPGANGLIIYRPTVFF